MNVPLDVAARCRATSADDFLDHSIYLPAFRRRATRLLARLSEQLQAEMHGGASHGQAWNTLLLDIVRVSSAHSAVALVEGFHSWLSDLHLLGEPSQIAALKGVIGRLFSLFSLYLIERDIGDFLEDNFLSGLQLNALRCAVRRLLKEIRPDAVVLVDAFNYRSLFLALTINA